MANPMEDRRMPTTRCIPSSSSSSSSASYATELVTSNEDLLREILLRVPARNLVRLRAVSRQWLSLIADPEFRRRHVAVHRSPSTILLHPYPSSAHYLLFPLSLDLISDTKEKTEAEASLSLHLPSARVVQSCNGLLLCRSRRDAGPSPDYYVFNPTTKEYSLILESGVWRIGFRMAVFGLALAFDPSRSPFYKAVCVRGTNAADYRHQIEVYSSKDREWRVCGSPFAAPFDMVFGDGVFWNGAVHWLSPTGASLFFDIDREVLGEMPRLPDIALNGGVRSSRRFRYFGHSGGHLHFFEIYGSTTAKFRVFEMQSDYSGWSPKFDVDLDPMIREFPETAREHHDMCGTINYYAFSVLLVSGEIKERGSLASIIIHVPGKVLSYDVNNKTFEKIYEIPPCQGKGSGSGKLLYGWLDAYEFIESLALV